MRRQQRELQEQRGETWKRGPFWKEMSSEPTIYFLGYVSFSGCISVYSMIPDLQARIMTNFRLQGEHYFQEQEAKIEDFLGESFCTGGCVEDVDDLYT